MLQESGLEDGFIGSSLYGSSSTMALLQGKSYKEGNLRTQIDYGGATAFEMGGILPMSK